VAMYNADLGVGRLVASGVRNTAGAAFCSATGLVSRAFEVEFDFQITNAIGGVFDEYGHFGPDGLTFFVTESPTLVPGGIGRGIGYEGMSPTSFAVEFDSFANPAYSDPSSNHVGLDVGGSMASITTAPVSTNFWGTGTWHARVRYESGTLTLFVTIPGGQ